MKNTVKYIGGTALLFVSCVTFAQTKESYYGKIGGYILQNYHPDSTALAKCCKAGCLFIKFHVDQRGELRDVSFGGDTNSTSFIRESLVRSVQMLKQDAGLIIFLKQAGKTIIQPFIFDYRDGCKNPDSATKSDWEFYNANMDLMSELIQGLNTSLFKMLTFNGKQSLYVDAVILSPVENNNVKLH